MTLQNQKIIFQFQQSMSLHSVTTSLHCNVQICDAKFEFCTSRILQVMKLVHKAACKKVSILRERHTETVQSIKIDKRVALGPQMYAKSSCEKTQWFVRLEELFLGCGVCMCIPI